MNEEEEEGVCMQGEEGLFKANRRLRPDMQHSNTSRLLFTPVGNTHKFVRDHLNFHWIASV
jgi:hypothetical protein